MAKAAVYFFPADRNFLSISPTAFTRQLAADSVDPNLAHFSPEYIKKNRIFESRQYYGKNAISGVLFIS